MISKLITSTEEFYNLKDDWERLQEQDKDATYYSTFQFNKTWWDVYKDLGDKSLAIICIYSGKKIVGIAPFIIEYRKKSVFSWRVLRFLGQGDYFGVISSNEESNEVTIINEVFNVIEKIKYMWDKIHLSHIKHNSELALYLLKSGRYNRHFKYLVECPCLYLNNYKNFYEYKKVYNVKRVRQLRNKLAREKKCKLRIVNGKSDYDIYEKISKTHQKEQQFLIDEKNRYERHSLFNDKYRAKFVKNIYRDNVNVINFNLEDDNGEVMAYLSCYLYKRVLHCWNSGFNPEWEKYSVGRVLDYIIIKYLFENDLVDIIDFGAGRYSWKFGWTRDFIYDYKLDIWNLESAKGKNLSKLDKFRNKQFS